MIYTLGLVAYMIVMLIIGYYAKGKVQNTEDYLVAGRNLNRTFSSFTLLSCFIGGMVVVGVSGTTFSVGIWNEEYNWGIIPALGGGAMCLLVCGLIYMPRLWKLKMVSLGDYYYARFGRVTGLVSTLMICSGFIFWTAVHILVFTKIVRPILGWSPEVAVISAVSIIVIYTIMGGLWAVAATDIFQVSLVIIGILVLTPVAIHSAGGWEFFSSNIPPDLVHFTPQTNSPNSWLAWIAAFLMMGIGGVPSPDIMQRAFAAKSANVARFAGCAAAVGCLFVGSLVVLLGLLGAELVGNGTIPVEALHDDPELIIPVMLMELLPVPLVVLFLGASLAAVMSAADSAMLALAGMFTKNIYKDILHPSASDKNMVLVTRICVGAVGILAGIIAVSFPYAFNLSVFAFDLLLASLFVPLTLGLFWKKANGYGAMAGMITGFAVRIIGGGMQQGFTLAGILSPLDTWYLFTLFSPLASLAAMVPVCLLTQKIDEPVVLEEYA